MRCDCPLADRLPGVVFCNCDRGPLPPALERRKICSQCDRNADGVCLETKRRHPSKAALISYALGRPEICCPLGKWKAAAE